MSSRPILFNDAMVRVILAVEPGVHKDVTRRPVRTHEPIDFIGSRGQENDPSAWGYAVEDEWMVLARGLHSRGQQHGSTSIPSPFGEAGDTLWVRECWNMRGAMYGKPAEFAKYASPDAFHYRATDNGQWRKEWGGWRPSIHMPRAASRILLEVIKVTVERIQDVTHEEAKREGFQTCHDFRMTWNAIYPDSWEQNEWVWRCEFKRLKPC